MMKKVRMRTARTLDPWTRARRAARVRVAVPEPEEPIQEEVQEEPTAKDVQKKPTRARAKQPSRSKRKTPWARTQAVVTAVPAWTPESEPTWMQDEPAWMQEELAQTPVQDSPAQVPQETQPAALPPLGEYVRIPEQKVAHPATVLVRLENQDKTALERQARKAKTPLAVYCRLALQWIARGGVAGGQS